jgi:Cu+-exporting ATPase
MLMDMFRNAGEIHTAEPHAGGDGTLPIRERAELPIEGMTCASCAARIERKLNKLDGVEASVNYATERASVAYDPATTPHDALVAAVEAAGYRTRTAPPAPAREAAEAGDGAAPAADPMLRRLIVAAALTLPVLVLAMVPPLQFDNFQWLSLQLATPVVLWAGWPFHRAALVNLRHGAATMDTLVSVGTLAAFGWSLYALFLGDAGMNDMRMSFDLVPRAGEGASHLYLETASVVTTFLLGGRVLEARAKRRAGDALRTLLELGARDAAVLDADGTERRVPVAELAVGDRFVVRPGEKVATDGVVEAGRSALDRSLLTGESAPVEVGPGDAVAGATVNAGGRLVVRATRVGADTALAGIARLVAEAQAGKAPVQRLADRVAAVFVPVVVVLAVATLGFWLGTGESAAFAFTAAVAVLIIACPCALGLATPAALMAGTGRGAQLGLLIRGPEVLEATRRVDTVLLDKTGTLTTGRMTLAAITPAPGHDAAAVLRLAGAVEDAAEHPVARAVAAAARERHGALPRVDAFTATAGLGAAGVVEGRAVGVHKAADDLPPVLAAARAEAAAQGRTTALVTIDGAPAALLAVEDAPRPSAAAAVAALRRQGLRPVLLTGDSAATAHAVAAQVGIDEVIAEVLPGEKAAVVARLQAEGRVVAMVGDGVNDAPALARADLGIAIGTGTDAAIAASDITLVAGDPAAVADALRLSRATLRAIRQNLGWAFGYNVAALPLAAAGVLSPVLAGLAMVVSSLSVLANALRLRRFRAAAG